MKVILSSVAKHDIDNFMKNTKQTAENANLYIDKLLEFLEVLATSSCLGKFLFYLQKKEIRQLIYKKHRIIYYISSDAVNIVSVVHTAKDIDRYIESLKENKI